MALKRAVGLNDVEHVDGIWDVCEETARKKNKKLLLLECTLNVLKAW